MQNRLYKKSTLLLGIIVVVNIAAIVCLIVFRKYWLDYALVTMLGFVLFLFILSTLYSFYDLNADILYIKKCVRNGDVALAKITDGTFYRVIRNAKFKTYVLWKLELTVFDQDMNQFRATTIEKFSSHQQSIPTGYVFITYNEKKPKDILVIPNVIIQSIPEYAPLVQDYEKEVKPEYLNAFIREGLLIQTYKTSLKEEKEQKEKLAQEAKERKAYLEKQEKLAKQKAQEQKKK